MEDELSLLQRARALEQEALALIHDRYYPSIYRYIAYRVNNPQTVEDLTSEVFIRLLNALQDKHAPTNTLQGWLYGVASRIIKEHYREKRKNSWFELEDDIANRADDPAKQVESNAEKEQLVTLMGDLSEDQQDVLALRFGYDMPIKEVAKTLGKSEGSIKMLQARAIAAIANRFVQGGLAL